MTKLLVERKCAEREDTAKLVDAIFANRQDYWICGEKVHIWLQYAAITWYFMVATGTAKCLDGLNDRLALLTCGTLSRYPQIDLLYILQYIVHIFFRKYSPKQASSTSLAGLGANDGGTTSQAGMRVTVRPI